MAATKKHEPAELNKDFYRYDASDELLKKAREEGRSDHLRPDVREALLRGDQIPSGTVVRYNAEVRGEDTPRTSARGGDGNTGSTATSASGGAG